jgi:F1F0 ATPase subunit 2
MIDWLVLFWALLAGAGLGLFYFGGLWLTVDQLLRASLRADAHSVTKISHPGALFFLSFIVRTAITLLGFYLVMGSRWERAAPLVIGFLLARLITVRYWGITPQRR